MAYQGSHPAGYNDGHEMRDIPSGSVSAPHHLFKGPTSTDVPSNITSRHITIPTMRTRGPCFMKAMAPLPDHLTNRTRHRIIGPSLLTPCQNLMWETANLRVHHTMATKMATCKILRLLSASLEEPRHPTSGATQAPPKHGGKDRHLGRTD